MKQSLKKCANPECGKLFLPHRPRSRYCSFRCCKRAGRLRYRKFNGIFHKAPGEEDVVLREFYCKQCSRLVQVCEETDKRTCFCCPECERKYWKHPEMDRHRRGGNRGLSGGMSLGSLIRREARNLTQ